MHEVSYAHISIYMVRASRKGASDGQQGAEGDGPLELGAAYRLASVFKSLADPTRLRIVAALSERELCVHELTERLEMNQPAVSQQLRLLRDRGLVRTRREGRHVYYRLDDEHVQELFERGMAHVLHR